MASVSPLAPLTPQQVRHAVNVLISFPLRRPLDKPVKHRELEFAERLLRQYVNSPSAKSPPSKEVLFEAVNSLLDPSCPPLASRWNKGQLAQVALEWISTVLGRSLEEQPQYFVRVHSKKGNCKDLEHETIFLRDTLEDGSVAGFSIYSPTTIPNLRKRVKKNLSVGAEQVNTPASASSAASSDTQFLREIENCCLSAEARADGFATPRVSETPAQGNDGRLFFATFLSFACPDSIVLTLVLDFNFRRRSGH